MYEGFQAYPLANGDTNENVIGNGAIGHGSNTTTLGNTSITDTYLAGTVHGTSFTGNAATATNVTGTVAIANGGTGATTAGGALANLGGAALSGAAFTGPVSIASTLSVANHSAFGANAVVDTLPPLELSNYGLVPSSVNTIYENSVSGVNGITLEIGWSPSGATNLYPQAINVDSEINFDNATGVLPAVGVSSFLLNLNGNTVKTSEAAANKVVMNNNGNADANILIASQEYINQFGTGIIDNASGVDSGIYIEAGTITNYSAFAAGGSAYTLGGTIGEYDGFSVQNFFTGVHGGTLNNVYGIKIGQLTGAVSSWGVYESGTEPNYFNGTIGIGTTNPGSKLTVKGGDVFVDGTAPKGVILRDTVTTTNCYRITVASGLVVPTLVTCPTD